MAYLLGQGVAKEIGDAHEQNPDQPRAEKRMDLRNNELGRWYATRVGWFSFTSRGEIREYCRKGAWNGQLQVRL